jgi:hypothetical protein
MVHPLLTALMLYDYYLLLGFTKVLNQTTFLLVLDQGKRHIYLNRLNFLGFQKAFEEKKVSLRTVRFLGEYVNEYVTLDNKGLLPSISRLMNFGGAKKKEEDKEKDKSNFKYFWKFAADNETFLIPYDHENLEDAVIDKQLLFDIINGRQNKVLDFDFS